MIIYNQAMLSKSYELELNRYADILVNFALNGGEGIKRNEVVFLQVPESAKPLLIALQKKVLAAGAHPIIQYLPDGIMKDFFSNANEEQIRFFPSNFLHGKVKQANHFLTIIAETDKHELEGIDPRKIMERNKSLKPYIDWRNKKENENKFTWTIALYPTEAMAQEAGITLDECWNQIIKACYLDNKNPLNKWRDVQNEIRNIKNELNKLEISSLLIESEGTKLTVGIGKNRKWLGGDGRNIPSFELFISPDWRQTEGNISFDFPLYHNGNLIKNINLVFKSGKIIKASAEKGERMLKEMIKVRNANKIGEFSLTDKRISRIDRFMAETLFDENYGGKNGNMHIAIGSAYKESYPGDLTKISSKQWLEMGFNTSAIHTDIISTVDRQVTAILENGSRKIIYKKGIFVV